MLYSILINQTAKIRDAEKVGVVGSTASIILRERTPYEEHSATRHSQPSVEEKDTLDKNRSEMIGIISDR